MWGIRKTAQADSSRKRERKKYSNKSIGICLILKEIAPVVIITAVLSLFIRFDTIYQNDGQGLTSVFLKAFKKINNVGLHYERAKESLASTAFSFLFAIYAVLGSSLILMRNRMEEKVFGIRIGDMASTAWRKFCAWVLIWMALLPILTLWFQSCQYVISMYGIIILSFSVALIQFWYEISTIQREKQHKLLKKYLYSDLNSVDLCSLKGLKTEILSTNHIYFFCNSTYWDNGNRDIERIYLEILQQIWEKEKDDKRSLEKTFLFSYEYACVLLTIDGKNNSNYGSDLLLRCMENEVERPKHLTLENSEIREKFLLAYIGTLYGLYSGNCFEIMERHIDWVTLKVYQSGDDGTGRKGLIEEMGFYLLILLEKALEDGYGENEKVIEYFGRTKEDAMLLWYNIKIPENNVISQYKWIFEQLDLNGGVSFLSCYSKLLRDKTENIIPESWFKIRAERGR